MAQITNATFNQINNILNSLAGMVLYTEADASDYSLGKLSPDLSSTDIDISTQGLSDPDYELTPTCDMQLWVESVTPLTITIGIGSGSETTNVTFRLKVFERFSG